LAGVAVFEALFVVGELKLDAALQHGVFAVFPFVQLGEVTQVTLAMRARVVGGEFFGAAYLQNAVDVVVVVGTGPGTPAITSKSSQHPLRPE
jgi:hypothetical protein